jgi:hypothetical protein
MRTCVVCKKDRTEIDFAIFRTSKSGMRNYYNRACRECNGETRRVVKELKAKHPTPPSGSSCECCGRITTLWLDHSHASGEFRGFVCRNCNVGMGMLGDSTPGLQRALSYLQRCEQSTTVSGGQVLVNSEPLLSEKA